MNTSTEFNLDKINVKEVKSSEQIKLHLVEEHIEKNPIEKASHLLSLGDDVQKLSTIQGLPELLTEDRSGCLQKVLPKMQQALVNGSTELHITTSLAIKSIIEENLISVDLFVRHFLHTVLQATEHKEPAVASAWTETLMQAIKVLPINVLQNEVATIASSKAQMGKTVFSRVLSCKILGELSSRYDPQLLKKELIPMILSLCQDTSPEVRAEMAKQMGKVATQLGQELSKSTMMQPLIELSTDDVAFVKENAFVSIVDTLQFFPPDLVKNAILPLFRQIIVLAFKLEDSFLVTISRIYGKMCQAIDKFVNNPEKELYVKWYIAMAVIGVAAPQTTGKTRVTRGTFESKTPEHAAGDPESSPSHRNTLVRQNSAANFAVMVKFSQELGRKGPLDFLHSTLKMLVGDPSHTVRKIIAGSLGEMVEVYWKQNKLLKDEFLVLSRDDSLEVLEALIPQVGLIMQIFYFNNVFKYDIHDETLVTIMRNLVKCEILLSKSYKWRIYATFFAQTRYFHRFVPSDLLYSSLVMNYIKVVQNSRVVPVRIAAMKSLIVYMRYTSKFQHRKEIRDRIISEYCLSNNFYDRNLFVKVLPALMDNFTSSFFKENFFIKAMNLVDDPVPNIRCSLIKLLPKFKAMIKLPVDSKLLSIFEASVATLADDKDRETKNFLRSMREAIAEADMAKLFPDEQKKIEEEKKSRKEEVPPRVPPPARPGTAGPSSKPGSSTSTPGPTATSAIGTDGRPLPPGRRSIDEMSALEKEFFIDAGIYLPDSVKQLPNHFDLKSNNNINLNNINNNNLHATQKKWTSSPRIPVRRPTNQRYSLHLSDSKNVTDPVPSDTEKGSLNKKSTTRATGHRSHLPRPLSCINFQTISTSKYEALSSATPSSKQKYVSRLPISNRQ